MNKYNFLKIAILIAILTMALAGFAQSQTIIVKMELSLDTTAENIPQATIFFEMEGNKMSVSAKTLKIDVNDLAFSTDFQGSEFRFRGKRADNKLFGTLDVVEKGKNVATGTWSLVRSGTDSETIAGKWTGTFNALPIPAQRADPSFDVSVKSPAYAKKHPRVLFDEAHNNFHTVTGLYKPFADLIGNDGYVVVSNKEKFVSNILGNYEILIIVNAAGPRGHRADPAFAKDECDAVREWVRSGGSLLFIADHAPMGAAAEILAKRFGVDMSKGYTDDVSSKVRVLGDITFSRENKLLADSPITRGRNASERISRIVSFTGQSLKGPPGSKPLLILPNSAVDTSPQTKQSASAAGRTQGLTIKFGKGRVVVLGEAAMLTAQIDDEDRIFGMNYPNIDNKQLALNIMHWLSKISK